MKDRSKKEIRLNPHSLGLVRGEDPVAWATKQLLYPYDKGILIDLIKVFGYAEASAVMHQVMADPQTRALIAQDFLANDIEYHVMCEPVRALVAFPLLCAGFGKQSSEIIESITRTDELADEALIELYLMVENDRACAALISRYTLDTLDVMEKKIGDMRAQIMDLPVQQDGISSSIWDEVQHRLNTFVPAGGSSASRELMQNIAGHTRPLPSLRPTILDAYLGTLAGDKSTMLWILDALCRNQKSEVVIQECAGQSLPRYFMLIGQISSLNEDHQNANLLELLDLYATKYLLVDEQAKINIQHPSVQQLAHKKIGQVASMLCRQRFSALNFNCLLELTRGLSPNLKPTATANSKVIDRFMGLAPLMAIDHLSGKGQRVVFRDELVAFGSFVIKKYQLVPDKLLAKVENSLQAEWVGRLTDPGLSTQLANNELMLNWKLENDLGL